MPIGQYSVLRSTAADFQIVRLWLLIESSQNHRVRVSGVTPYRRIALIRCCTHGEQAEMYKEAMAYLMTPPRDAHGTPALEHDYSSSAITSPPVGQNRSSLTSTAALSDSTLRASVTRTLLEGHGEGHEERMAISREGSTELSSEATSPLDVSDYEGGGQEPSGVSSFSDVMLMSRSASSANRFSKVRFMLHDVRDQRHHSFVLATLYLFFYSVIFRVASSCPTGIPSDM